MIYIIHINRYRSGLYPHVLIWLWFISTCIDLVYGLYPHVSIWFMVYIHRLDLVSRVATQALGLTLYERLIARYLVPLESSRGVAE